ncbi:MAG: glycosyltransferase family 4 protein [Coleofasciculaceae cyanobacterium SM2_1_6]|nr:glycosyltransferase family 4 protein [Coleofasciculaceae cyanobacterium SM2_1_6]
MAKTIALLAPDLHGGATTRVYLLAQVLQKLGHTVKIYGLVFGERVYPAPPENLEVFALPGGNYPQIIPNLRELLTLMASSTPDLLYAVKPRPTSLGLALIKRWQTGIPVMLDLDDWEMSWHGGDDWQYRPTIKQLARDVIQPQGALRNPNHPLYVQWSEKLIAQADALTVDTRFLQYRFGGTYLPNGKDVELFNPANFDPTASRLKYGFQDYRVLLFPGTARPHKGLEDVLAALEQLDQPDYRLVIVGGTEIGDNYLEQLMQRWGRWILKLPQFPPHLMPEIVAAAHIFVVPQREDLTAIAQFPIKLTEGMAMAKPILATRVGDIPEILADTGYLVTPGAIEEIALKIQWIWDHLDTANLLGNQSRQRCIELYSFERMATILSKIVDRL